MANQQVAVQVNTVYRAPTGATSLIRNTKPKYERNWHIQNCETRDAFQPKPVCTFHDWLQIDNKQRRRQKLSLIYNATQSSWDDDDGGGLSRADWTLISPQSQHSYRIPNITSLHNGTHCSRCLNFYPQIWFSFQIIHACASASLACTSLRCTQHTALCQCF